MPIKTSDPSAALPVFSAALKDRTKEHHLRAEHHPLQQALARGTIDAAVWTAMVIQNRAVHAAMESALAAAALRDERVARVFAPHHRRLSKFDADLAALGVAEASRAALPTTQKACAWITELGARDPLALLGVLYVLEGATNGGQYLAHPLRAMLKLGGDAGLLSLHPHGEQTRDLWMGFRASVDALVLSDIEVDAVIAAAQETFDLVGRVLDGVKTALAAA